MHIKGISLNEFKIPVRAFNMETKEWIGEFESQNNASELLGVDIRTIHRILMGKCRKTFSKKLNAWVTFRHLPNKKD